MNHSCKTQQVNFADLFRDCTETWLILYFFQTQFLLLHFRYKIYMPARYQSLFLYFQDFVRYYKYLFIFYIVWILTLRTIRNLENQSSFFLSVFPLLMHLFVLRNLIPYTHRVSVLPCSSPSKSLTVFRL